MPFFYISDFLDNLKVDQGEHVGRGALVGCWISGYAKGEDGEGKGGEGGEGTWKCQQGESLIRGNMTRHVLVNGVWI